MRDPTVRLKVVCELSTSVVGKPTIPVIGPTEMCPATGANTGKHVVVAEVVVVELVIAVVVVAVVDIVIVVVVVEIMVVVVDVVVAVVEVDVVEVDVVVEEVVVVEVDVVVAVVDIVVVVDVVVVEVEVVVVAVDVVEVVAVVVVTCSVASSVIGSGVVVVKVSIVVGRIDKIVNSTVRPASNAIAAILAPTLALPAGLSAMAMAAAAFDWSMVIVILVSSWTERLDVRLNNVRACVRDRLSKIAYISSRAGPIILVTSSTSDS